MENKELLQSVFGYPKTETKPTPPPFVPDFAAKQKKWEDKQPFFRDIPPDTTANVQALIWGYGAPPPPKPPAKAVADQGTAAEMQPQEGWGKING